MLKAKHLDSIKVKEISTPNSSIKNRIIMVHFRKTSMPPRYGDQKKGRTTEALMVQTPIYNTGSRSRA